MSIREIVPTGPVQARIIVPGSKSMTNRALICAALAKGESVIDSSQQAALATLVARLKDLDALLKATGRRAQVEVLGYADSDGPDDLNAELSDARADRVLTGLRDAELERIELSGRGMGRAPTTPNATEADLEQERRASFTVHVTEDLLRSNLP